MADRDAPATPGQVVAFSKAQQGTRQTPTLDVYEPSYMDWETLEERGEPPAREWALDNWFGLGHVTMLAAKGGMGKSVLAQQLATALALKRDFVSTVSEARRVLLWMGEDDDDELWRRQRAICAKLDVPLGALRGRVYTESMVDTDCCLMAKIIGAGLMRTPMITTLREQIGDLKCDAVILDNSAKLYQGNENDRAEVTAFITALTWAAAPTKAAMLLISHVAKPKDSEFSGSSAWENTVRSRWWLTNHPPDKPEPEKDEDSEAPLDLRYLAKRKVNYTNTDVAVLRYTAGAYDVLTNPTSSTGLVGALNRDLAMRIVMESLPKLWAMGIEPTESHSSPHYLPKMIIRHGLGDRCTKVELGRAMSNLMTDGKLKREKIGTYSNRSPRFGVVFV